MENETKKPHALDSLLQKLNKTACYPVYAFFIACIAFLLSLTFLDILGYDNQTIFRSDMYGQYIPFIQMFLRALTGEESFWYSFSLFLGSGTILTYAYYTFSPFNLLYLIDGISVSAITATIITLKLGLSALTFQIFVQKALKQRQFSTVLLSVCYGLCGYAVTMHYHIMWLEAIYMLPIILWLIIRFIKSGKYLGLVFSYAYLFITNFYTAYMVGIFSALFYICYLCYQHFSANKAAIKKCFGLSFKFAGVVLLSVGLSAIVLLPAALFLLSHMAADNAAFDELKATIPDIINSMFAGQMQTLDTQVPMLYCGIPVLLLVPFYYANKEISLKEKVCFTIPMIFLFLGMLFLPLYKFMHAFDYPNMYGFRFAFLLVFLLVAIACRQLPYMEQKHFKPLAIYSGALVVFYSLMIPLQNLAFPASYYTNTQNGLILNILLIALWIFIFHFVFVQKKTNFVLITGALVLLIGELSINSYICISREEHTAVPETTSNTWNARMEEAIETLNSKDSSFYRINVNNSLNYNAASYWGYNGLTTFSSSDDYPLRNVLSHLGVATSNRFIGENGYTPLTDMLFGVKYAINLEPVANEENITDFVNYSISENAYTLPLGYMVSAQIVNYAATDDPFYNQMQLLTLMTSEQCPPIYTVVSSEDLKMKYENMAIDYAESGVNFYHLSDYNINSAISFSAPTIEGKEFYACFTQITPGIYSDSPRIVAEPVGMADEVVLSYGCIVKGVTTGLHETPHDTVILYFYPDRSWDYGCNNMYFYYYDDSLLEGIYADLAPGGWNIETYEDDYISGTVTATEERPILFTSIPYDSGWTAFVDGVETPIYSTLDNAFVSIILEPGTHEVTLQYNTEGKDLGEIITTFSVGILLILILLGVFKHTTNNKNSDASNSTDESKEECNEENLVEIDEENSPEINAENNLEDNAKK